MGSSALFWILCIGVVGVPLLWTRNVLRGFSIPKDSLFLLIIAAASAAWVLDSDEKIRLRLPRGSGDRSGLILLAVAALSISWAYAPLLGLLSLLRLLALGAFYFLLNATLNSERRTTILLVLFLSAVGVVAAYGLLQFYDMFNYPGPDRPFLVSTLGHPNYASSFVGMGCPIFIALAIISRGWKRWLCFTGGCLGFAFLLAAQTRSVWVATLIALGIGGVLAVVQPACRVLVRGARKLLVVLLAACLLLILVFSVENPLNRRISIWSRAAAVVTRAREEHVTVGSRWLMWKATLLMIKEHPLLGVGFGNFGAYSAEYLARARETSPRMDSRYRTEFVTEPHNDYLQLLAELGPGGLLAFLWFIGWHLVLAKRRLTAGGIMGHEALWLIGLLTALVVFLIDAFFSLPFSILNSSVAAVILLVAIRRAAASREAVALHGRAVNPVAAVSPISPRGVCVSRRLVAAVVLGAAAVTSGWAAALFLADSFVLRGERARKADDFPATVGWFEKAVRANPLEWRYRLGRAAAYTLVFRYRDALHSTRQAEEFVRRAMTAENMGIAYAGLGDMDRALTEFRRALWYEPHSPLVRDELVALLLEQKRFTEAANEAAQGLRQNPEYGMLHLHLAMAQAALGQEDAALASAQAAAGSLPSNGVAFSLLRDLASRAGIFELVEAAGRRLRAISHYETFHRLRRGGATNPQPGTSLLNALVVDPQFADPHFELGVINREQGAAQEAIAEFQAYLRLAPRGNRAFDATRLLETLRHPSWLARVFGVDWRLRD